MKKFNKTISIEVSLDAIANQLLSTISDGFAHRELIVETIIGTAHENGSLGAIYSALSGYKTELDFEIGQEVAVSDVSVYSYVSVPTSDTNPEKIFKEQRVPVLLATVREINLYKSNGDCVMIEYAFTKRDGSQSTAKLWVDHSKLSLPVTENDNIVGYPH